MSDVRETVRERYGRIAVEAPAEGCCGGGSSCGSTTSLDIGYGEKELSQLPEGANLGLGCGNPQGIAALPGKRCSIGKRRRYRLLSGCAAGRRDGEGHRVDMTPQMLARARANAAKSGARNVEFRLGEIEHSRCRTGAST